MVQKNSKIIFFFGIIIVIIIAIIVTLNLTKKNSSPISFNRKKWMEKKAIEFLFDYYSKLGNDYFNVNAYYAPLVRKYYLKDSLTTDEISDLYYDSYLPEYHDPVYIVDSNSIKKALKPLKFSAKYKKGTEVNFYWLSPTEQIYSGRGFLVPWKIVPAVTDT